MAWGIVLAGRGFRRLGFWTINIGFKTGEGLLGSFARVLNSKILCAPYCPTSSQIQPTSPRKHETGMSSSDSISLSTSNSNESTESERSRGRQFDEEGTSSGGMASGIPMETMREVREDPPEELAESNWPAKGGYGWAATDVRNQSSLFQWSRLLNSWLNCTPVISKGVSGDIVSLERVSAIDRYAMGRRVLQRSFSTCICAIFLNFMCCYR